MTVSAYIWLSMVSRAFQVHPGAMALPCGFAAFSPPLSFKQIAYESSAVV
jgi:hypothetical protein